MSKTTTAGRAALPAPLLAEALRRHAASLSDNDYGLRAAVRLLCEYQGGRLLDTPAVRRHVAITGRGDLAHAVVDWSGLHAQTQKAEDTRDTASRDNACLLICCALAAGTPLLGLSRLLARIDGWNARHVLYAVYYAAGGDERDVCRGWLAYCANAHLASKVDIEMLAQAIDADAHRPAALRNQEAQINAATAQTHLSRVLKAPTWALLPRPEADYRACVWQWEAANTCRVEVAITRRGVLTVTLNGEGNQWEVYVNGGSRVDHPSRSLTLLDLMSLRDNLRYAGIPVGDL